ncbi:MAG: helix-turn-helix domain-containing protein [Rhodospirillales bacterium]|nr:helix-turn-helix domain-containing protein [Rhodospirillales bacterium]
MTQPVRAQYQPVNLVVLVVTQFPSMAASTLTTIFRVANRELGQTLYRWQMASAHGGIVEANDGSRVVTEACASLRETANIVFVLASYTPLPRIEAPLRSWLRAQRRQGARLVGVESGTRILAQLGQLGDHAVALHPEDEASFREAWPDQPIHRGLFNIDRGVASVAGVSATTDLALALIEHDVGTLLADQVARVCLHARRDALGRVVEPAPEHGRTTVLERCRALMQNNLQEPLRLTELCRKLEIDERRLRRLFRKALGVSPMRYYQALRLTEARYMLVGTDMAVTDVALACGFDDPSSFARAFRGHFGFAPSTQREPYVGLLPSPFWPEERDGGPDRD